MTIVEFSYYRFIFANHTMIVEVTNAFGISLTLIKWPKNGWGNGIKMSKTNCLHDLTGLWMPHLIFFGITLIAINETCLGTIF